MNKKSLLTSLKWTFSVSRRFARIDRKGRTAATSFLSTVGICFGVMSLISVISVMNGFQRYSINPIMEISSSHLRVSNLSEEKVFELLEFCDSNKKILCALPFMESQGLLCGNNAKTQSAIVRGIDKNILLKDSGFYKEAKTVAGSFDLLNPDSIVLGSALAHNLGVTVGSTVNLMALAGGRDVDLISQNRIFKVTGIFESTYYDINAGFGFINIEDAAKYFGKDSKIIYGIKLADYDKDIQALGMLHEKFPEAEIKSWREYNRSFFGTLRIEKNILMLLVCIIFVVVGVNIYNGMRRLVFERRQEISIFSALGASKLEIKSIFILRGFTCGLYGALSGMILGLLISYNIKPIFLFIGTLTQNTMFDMFAQIPACVFAGEVCLITLFGVLAPLAATTLAANNILDLSVAEVLHDE